MAKQALKFVLQVYNNVQQKPMYNENIPSQALTL